jgi:hypothetical protein
MSKPEFDDVLELAKGVQYALVLDESLRALEVGLEEEGYKVITALPGSDDQALKRLAKGGWCIVTDHSEAFIADALHYDYDIIGLDDLALIDAMAHGINETVVKIVGALQRSGVALRKGNFVLTIREDGAFHLRQLP